MRASWWGEVSNELENVDSIPGDASGGKRMAKPLAPGDHAPNFELVDQHGDKVTLQDFQGRKLLVYFYPEAGSEDCTAQSCNLRDSMGDFSSLSIDVLGISPDPAERQLDFDRRHGLGFPLLSDQDHSVAERFGVWDHYEYLGQQKVGIIRSSFLINEEGVVLEAWSPITAEETAPKALAYLEGNPQTSD